MDEDDDNKWVKDMNASIARINHAIRTSGGIGFWDMRTFKEMVTVLNGPPVPAWPLELRRKTHDNTQRTDGVVERFAK